MPPISPDLNPIENFFHSEKRKLRQDVIRVHSFTSYERREREVEQKRTPCVQGAGRGGWHI